MERALPPPQDDLAMRKQSKDGSPSCFIDVRRRSSPEEIDVKDRAYSRFGGTPLTNGEATYVRVWSKLSRALDILRTTALPPHAYVHPLSCYVPLHPKPDS